MYNFQNHVILLTLPGVQLRYIKKTEIDVLTSLRYVVNMTFSRDHPILIEI